MLSPYLRDYSSFDFPREELLEISISISRDFSPVFATDRSSDYGRIKLSSRELLEISEAISLAYQPRISKTTELILLPVDPEHLYVYWHQPDLKFGQKEDDGHQATLRVYTQSFADDDTPVGLHVATWFDVDMQQSGYQQKLTIPACSNDVVFSAQIGIRSTDDNFVATANSNKVSIPRQSFANSHAVGRAQTLKGLSELPEMPEWQLNASGQRLPKA